MSFQCGILGLPNVGKSTLFNALTKTALAQASNFPFCTIEPNRGTVCVPDERLENLATISRSKTTVPTSLEFVDIAGLVKGASKGEGLGNQFLGHVRSVDALVHVVRCFEDDSIVHVEGDIDPKRDIDLIETELMLSDMESLNKQLDFPKRSKNALKGPPQDPQKKEHVLRLCLASLEEGRPVRLLCFSEEEEAIANSIGLLTKKPVLYVANVSEKDLGGNPYTRYVHDYAKKNATQSVIVAASIESEIALLAEGEKKEFLLSLGLEEEGLCRIVKACYALLGLLTFFTVGPNETRAWTLLKGCRAPEAAGRIHSDFARGFICAETVSYQDFIHHQGEKGARNSGKYRTEGRHYIVQEGDILLFRHNV